MIRGRYLRSGLVLALVYVGLAVAYNSRPLFDGFAPPAPYNWVNPPKEFRSGNTVPKPSTVDVTMGPTGSAQGGGSSGDGQVIVSVAAGAFAAHPPDSKVVVHITPVDPATLGAPPAGLLADGNAYKLDFVYDPSKAAAPSLAAAMDVFLVVPQPAQTMLFSADGKTWAQLPFRPVPDPTQIGGGVTGPGYLLAVAPPVGKLTAGGNSDDGAKAFGAVTAVAVLALALWFVPVGLRRLRGRSA